jgi:hypothetical protein
MSNTPKPRKKGVQKLVSEALTVLLPRLQAENEQLKKQVEVLKGACRLSVEFGYNQCEKGENIQAALLNYEKIMKIVS